MTDQEPKRPWLDDKINERDANGPLPGVNDKGEPDRIGQIPPQRDEITSGESGGVHVPEADIKKDSV